MQKLSDILAQGFDAVIFFDAQQQVTLWNTQAERLFAVPTEKALGRTLDKLSGAEALSAIVPLVRAAFRGRARQSKEASVARADGSTAVLEMRVTRLAQEKGVAVIARDITMRRGTETLKGVILDTSLDGFILTDHEGRILDWNRASERIFGRQREEMLGQLLGETIVPERLREEHRRELARYAQGRGERPLGERYEVPALRSDGTEFPSEVSITHIPGMDPPLFARFVRDITERKEAEVKLNAAKAEADTAAQEAAAIVGCGDYMEIWERESWVQEQAALVRISRGC